MIARITLLLVALWVPFSLAAQGAPQWYFATANDSIGEARDRWRTSSVQAGRFFGANELRFRSDIYAPANVAAPAAGDRLHAGVLAVGLHRHGARRGWDWRLGAELVVVGPQTGMLSLQREVHELLGFAIPNLDNYQVRNDVTGLVSAEAGRAMDFRGGVLRPFVEAQTGPEDLVRVGVDFSTGQRTDRTARFARMMATGHRLPVDDAGDGLSFYLGADVAAVEDSIFLPEAEGFEPEPFRTRVRAGAHYDFGRFELFYGSAWLSPEFRGQPTGQIVGAVSVRYRF